MLRSDISDYSDAYIVAKGIITVEGTNDRDKHNKNLILKSNAAFISCASKINGTLIDNAEDLYVLMPIYKLIEYSGSYSKTFGTLLSYYEDISVDPIANSESFKYKTSITGKTANDGIQKSLGFLLY